MKTKRTEWGQPSSTFPQERELTERERIICVVRTKLAYALADVANSLLMDCEHTYNRVALGLKPAEKSRFKYLQQQAMRLKYAAKDATKTMYDLDMDAYYDDSDRLQEFLLTPSHRRRKKASGDCSATDSLPTFPCLTHTECSAAS